MVQKYFENTLYYYHQKENDHWSQELRIMPTAATAFNFNFNTEKIQNEKLKILYIMY